MTNECNLPTNTLYTNDNTRMCLPNEQTYYFKAYGQDSCVCPDTRFDSNGHCCHTDLVDGVCPCDSQQ